MTSHARLFGIDLKHSYYSNGLCSDFSVLPDSGTERLLKNHRCVFKPRSSGADIYVELGDDGKPKIPFSISDVMGFELRLKNPEFPLFTDSTPLAGAGDLQISYPSQSSDNFFIRIEIRRDFNQTGGSNVEIAFSAKPVLWVYYLITNQGGLGDTFSVVAQDSQAITWKQADGKESIFLKLADQYPDTKRLRFASEQLAPCREAGLQHIQLLLGGNTVIESLPNPSWRNYFQTEAANGGRVDAIFAIVKYLTNTTLTKV